MFDFDPNGQVALITLDLIHTVNEKYPDLDMETAAMAGLMFTLEKAVLAKIAPMDFIMAMSMAWTFVAGMQSLVELAAQTPPPPEEAPPAATPPAATEIQLIHPLAPGVH